MPVEPPVPDILVTLYHHLIYFRMVAKQGGLAKAAENLRLSPSTVSTQIG